MKDFLAALRAWLNDPMTQTAFCGVMAWFTAESILAAHRRIDRAEDQIDWLSARVSHPAGRNLRAVPDA